jgi:hypothetical protein
MNGITPAIAPRIGGRLETASPTHAVMNKDRFAIFSLLVIAICIHGWLFSKTIIPARDGLSFSRLAVQIDSPKRIAETTPNSTNPNAANPNAANPKAEVPVEPTLVDVLQKAEQPPGFPATILVVSKVISTFTSKSNESLTMQELGERMLLSGQISCCVGGILLVIPMFLLGRMLMNRFVGFAAAALFQCLPVAAHVTSDCLSEGWYLTGLMTALWLGARGMRRTGLGNFLAAGLVIGATYLIRPEALLLVIAISSVIAWQAISKKWAKSQSLICATALLVGVAITSSPYMLTIGSISNKPSGREMLNNGADFVNPKQNLKVHNDLKPIQQNANASLFAMWATEKSIFGRVVFACSAVFRETAKSGHYFIVFLATLGMLTLRKRIMADPASLLFVALAGFNSLLLLLLAAKIGYVSERHTLPIVAVLCLFAAASVEVVIRLLSVKIDITKIRWMILAVLMGISLPMALRPLHQNRIGLKMAGEFLGTVFKDGDAVVDPFSWSEYYAGITVSKVHKEPEHAKTIYVVLHGPADTSSHERLPKLQLAKDIANSGKIIYQWPESVPQEQAKVFVYKTLRHENNK